MARDGINNLICDNILRKFDGHKSITREKMRSDSFYSNIDGDWTVVERHIDFLIRDRALKEDEDIVSLTNKGWFMMNNAEKVGYVAQKIDDVQWRKSERDGRVLLKISAFAVLGVIVIWSLIKLATPLA
ncbi:hypothetical protein WBG78_18425 [Chryseolinea sp. T2]|uniref:hypothetical protein n=1 Tax=Chryseolinea sp. T2 TaxID=3129255 RepID=UPI003077E4BB